MHRSRYFLKFVESPKLYIMEIREFAFSREGLRDLSAHAKGQNWPVVYLINNDKLTKKELYIGETTSASGRFRQHLNDKEARRRGRHTLESIRFIFDDQFNKSAILDIEQTLIQMFMADQKYVLQNRNGGQSCKHNYYQRALYQAKVDEIWSQLKTFQIVNNDVASIRNSNLFKYSPYNTLTPEQEQVSYDILYDIMDCLNKGETGTSVLSGIAGTGKSIVLIHMMYTLMSAMTVTFNDEGLSPEEHLELGMRISLVNSIKKYVERQKCALKIAFVVPMTSIRMTFKGVFSASKGSGLKASMVIGPQEVLKDDYDIVFVDESHRLSRRKAITSYGSFDKACKSLGLNKNTATQLDMIQKKSKYSVLVYDENQTVKASDLTPDQFKAALKWRDRHQKRCLLSQMRCEGGSFYTSYLDDIFQMKSPAKQGIDCYDFKLWNDPNAMIREIKKKDAELSLCRTVAGYSWRWKSKSCSTVEEAVRKGKEDIDLEGIKYVWNMSNQEWILREGAENEIGCIHTTQGYDLNYVAVVFGKEIDYDETTDSIVINKSKFYDAKVKSGVSDAELKNYIINSYKVMMTRGIKGCYVYACNPRLQNYLKRFITEA